MHYKLYFWDCSLSRSPTTVDLVISKFPIVIEEVLNLDNCCRVPPLRNSVFLFFFFSLRRSLLYSIHERMFFMQFFLAYIASC